jgi:hypothetical protein
MEQFLPRNGIRGLREYWSTRSGSSSFSGGPRESYQRKSGRFALESLRQFDAQSTDCLLAPCLGPTGEDEYCKPIL